MTKSGRMLLMSKNVGLDGDYVCKSGGVRSLRLGEGVVEEGMLRGEGICKM